MKRLALALMLACLTAVGAFSQTNTKFDIKFNIKGLDNGKAYVTIFGEENATIHDEIRISSSAFTFKGSTTASVVARISFEQDQLIKKIGNDYIPSKASCLWVIVEPGASFSVEGSIEGKDYVNIFPKGTVENATLAQLNSKMMPLINESVNLSMDLQLDKTMNEEKKKQKRIRLQEINTQINKVKYDFISTKSSSIAALWLMDDMLIRSEIETSRLTPILAKVNKKYSSNFFYKTLKSRTEGALATAIGKKCPEIETTSSYNGKPFSLSSLLGKYVIIDFWGTWCGPCVKGMPRMKAFRDKYADKVQIVSISNDKDEATWKSAIDRIGMNWPNILTGSGEKNFVAKFNIQGFPTKVLVGPDGTILYRETGESEHFYEEIEKIILK